jgi:hypothetical protein
MRTVFNETRRPRPMPEVEFFTGLFQHGPRQQAAGVRVIPAT